MREVRDTLNLDPSMTRSQINTDDRVMMQELMNATMGPLVSAIGEQ